MMESDLRPPAPSRAMAFLLLAFGLAVAGGLVLLIWATTAGGPGPVSG